MLGLVHLSGAIRELHATRKELARLKVEEERQRLSRDLHDLLGQTLSMIALKSELAQLLAVEDQQRCVQEIAEIERVARRSLREVREAVAGYRQPRLESELEGARQILEAAEIDVQIEALRETLPQPLDTALAWTVREGVTNVIRHSRAQQCWIRLTQREGIVRAEVLNDGGERRPEEKPSRRGLGLAGLRERVSPLGGIALGWPTGTPEQRALSPLCGTALSKKARSIGFSGGRRMIRVLLAEDQAMVRGVLSALLSREKDIEVVAEVARGDEVVQTALTTHRISRFWILRCRVSMDLPQRRRYTKPCPSAGV
jgi:two-component sensor histidine kinase